MIICVHSWKQSKFLLAISNKSGDRPAWRSQRNANTGWQNLVRCVAERPQHDIENTAALKWEMQWHRFKEINWVFNTDNFDSRQQFSLAQQFAMQNNFHPYQEEKFSIKGGEQSREGLICLDIVFYRAEFQVRHESNAEKGLKQCVRTWARSGGKRRLNPLTGEWPPAPSPHLWKIQSSSDQPTPPRFRALQLCTSPAPENVMACGALQQNY